jgi:hypothetical protein
METEMYKLKIFNNGRALELARGTALELIERILENWENLFCDEDGNNLDVFAYTGSRSEVFAIEPA